MRTLLRSFPAPRTGHAPRPRPRSCRAARCACCSTPSFLRHSSQLLCCIGGCASGMSLPAMQPEVLSVTLSGICVRGGSLLCCRRRDAVAAASSAARCAPWPCATLADPVTSGHQPTSMRPAVRGQHPRRNYELALRRVLGGRECGEGGGARYAQARAARPALPSAARNRPARPARPAPRGTAHARTRDAARRFPRGHPATRPKRRPARGAGAGGCGARRRVPPRRAHRRALLVK